jgi:hypothetical protein
MNNLNLILPSLIVCFLFVIVGESGSCRNHESPARKTTVTNKEKLPAGVWGGQHIRMDVTANGANLEYDCAASTIDEPIVLDGDGNFDVKGKYSPQHGGPARRDEETDGPAAHYVGQVKDNEMTLTITIADKKDLFGSFNLRKGSEGRLMKCR